MTCLDPKVDYGHYKLGIYVSVDAAGQFHDV